MYRMVFRTTILLVLTGLSVLGNNDEEPFVAIWNSPTIRCQLIYDVDMPLSEYGILENTGGLWKGDKIVIFYEPELGCFPYLTPDEIPINGGIPQSADIGGHLRKAKVDIARTIPDEDFSGYAVIDWESWRPTFDRNWLGKRVYQQWSVDLVRQAHPTWREEEMVAQARRDFEKAARFLMEETLKLGRRMRPRGKWGFYGFPQCYNTGGLRANCTQQAMLLNDQLHWMYKASNVIYPSAYIRNTNINPRSYIYGQSTEGLRIRKKFCSSDIPILLYVRYTVGDHVYHTEEQMEASVQITSDQGYNGVILWGSSASISRRHQCQSLQNFIRDKFGPFVENVLEKSRTCGLNNCGGHGRCVKKDPLLSGHIKHLSYHSGLYEGNAYYVQDEENQAFKKVVTLFLDSIFSFTGSFKAIDIIRGTSSDVDKNGERKNNEYLCNCFVGWTGEGCSQVEIPPQVSNTISVQPKEELLHDVQTPDLS